MVLPIAQATDLFWVGRMGEALAGAIAAARTGAAVAASNPNPDPGPNTDPNLTRSGRAVRGQPSVLDVLHGDVYATPKPNPTPTPTPTPTPNPNPQP